MAGRVPFFSFTVHRDKILHGPRNKAILGLPPPPSAPPSMVTLLRNSTRLFEPGLAMLPATLFSPKLFPSLLRPLPSLRNNEVTVLNVSRTGDHREWGAKSPSTPCLVMARKGKGQFENRPLSFTAVRKCWRPFEKVKIFSGNGARHCLSPPPPSPLPSLNFTILDDRLAFPAKVTESAAPTSVR